MLIALTSHWLGIAALAAAGALTSFHASAQVGQKPEAKVEPGGGANKVTGFDPLEACSSEIDRQISAMNAYLRTLGSRGMTDAEYVRNQYRSSHRTVSCDPVFLSQMAAWERQIAEARAHIEQEQAGIEVNRCIVRAIRTKIANYCDGERQTSTQRSPMSNQTSQASTLQRPASVSAPVLSGSSSVSPRLVQSSAPSTNHASPSPLLAGNSTDPQSVLQDIVNNERSRPPAASDNDIRMHYQAAERAARRAFNDDADLKKTKIHNNANDATQCLKIEPTGVRSEWGIQGRFRLINTCNFPVEASWCANEMECASGHGNLWTLRGGTDWPIFFANITNPMIRVGACRALWAKQPFPSDAALARAGGINARHNDPPSAPGVGRMPGHLCE